MSRWTIEKDGTGIEKSGTGIEKSGAGVEKSGTGIERSGTGIEKSGTGIQRFIFACAVALMGFTSTIQANALSPAGSLQLVVDRETVAVSWIIDGSIFSGVAPLVATFASLELTEISLASNSSYSTEVTGNGTGSSKLVTGNGTGSSKMVTGNGTGSSKLVTGNGTGLSVQVTGNGTGSSALVTGNGTGSSILVTGNGSGADSIYITLPSGTGLGMEISLGCKSANVTIMDANNDSVARFENVNVIGSTGLCAGGFGGRSIDSGFVSISN